VLEATQDWSYDVISLGYPGLLLDGKPVEDLHGFDEVG
jgi:hypothetical protein